MTAHETQKRDLTTADIEGMCEAYPVALAPQDPVVSGCSVAAGRANGESNRAAGVALVFFALACAGALEPNGQGV